MAEFLILFGGFSLGFFGVKFTMFPLVIYSPLLQDNLHSSLYIRDNSRNSVSQSIVASI